MSKNTIKFSLTFLLLMSLSGCDNSSPTPKSVENLKGTQTEQDSAQTFPPQNNAQ